MSVTVSELPVPEPEQTPAQAAPAAVSTTAATRTSRLAAAILDTSILLLFLGASRLWVEGVLPADLEAAASPLLSFAAFPLLVLLAQWVLLARGGTLGMRVTAIAPQLPSGARPGIGRSVFGRGLPVALTAAALTWAWPFSGEGTEVPSWLVRWALPVALVLGVDVLFALLPGGRALRDRFAGTRMVSTRQGVPQAFDPPTFCARGFVVALGGIVLSGLVAARVYLLVSGQVDLESTELDVPLLVSGAVLVLGLIVSGASSSFAGRRFLVGELALVSLLCGALGFEAMALGLVPVPGMRPFETAGLLDWSVYSVGFYFGALVFLVIGSAVGFMLAGRSGLDLSTRFERLVARRHLRLRVAQFLQLALIATLLPVLIYGLVWPLRATWRLVRGMPAPAAAPSGGFRGLLARVRGGDGPLPPTVFMALLTIVGVMFGVMSLTVVLAVMGGFERDLKEKILGTNAHGLIHRYTGDFTEWRDVEAKVKAVAGVRGVTPFIFSEVMLTADNAVTGAVLKGIDVETVGQVTDIETYVEPGNGRLRDLLYPDRIPRAPLPPPSGAQDEQGLAPERPEPAVDDALLPGIAIGREMARTLHVWIGDRVTVMNPLGELGPTGPIPRSKVFRVAAVFVSGFYEYDSKFAYIHLPEAQKFFRMGDSVTGLELRFRNVDEARPLVRRIVGALEGFPYRGQDWGQMNKNLFSALRLERVVMFVLLSFQVLIACICVIATLVMLVVEKRKEVAVLKAMGAREGSIMKLFVLEGLIIGAIGVFYGSAAGYLFCKLIEKFGVNLDPEVYYIPRLPVVIEPAAFLSVALVAMVLVFVATIYPARRGGSIAPVEGFREE